MKRKLILITLLAAASAFAQSKPNFTGTWKLDVAKSDFGVMAPPESRTDKIQHDDPSVKINVDSDGPEGKMQYDVAYTTDGKESVNKVRDTDAKITAEWDGPILVVNTKLTIQDNEIAIKSKVNLSEDGKTLTQDAHITSPMGELDQKLIFNKQEAK